MRLLSIRRLQVLNWWLVQGVAGLPMANSVGQREASLPVFELSYFDSLTGGPNHVRSNLGKIFVRLPNGGPFHWISLRILSSAIPLKLKYKCLCKRPGNEADILVEAAEGERCPPEDAAYIKQVTFEFKIYYRCWLSRDGHPEAFDPHPTGAFW